MTAGIGIRAQLIGLLGLAFTIFFIAAFAGSGPLAVAVVLVGIGAPFLTPLLGIYVARWWPLPAILTTVFLGVLGVLALVRPVDTARWSLAPILFITVSIAFWVSRMTRRRCSLCHRRLGLQAITFGCPRCGLEVCDEFCWNYEHRRCRMCEENHVPILPAQSQWWDRQLGPSMQQGRCQMCMASPEQSDLRGCGHCHRPQCRDCWDQNNGECSRCGWKMPNLPESLEAIAVNLPAHK